MRLPKSTRVLPMTLRVVEQEASLGRVLDFMRLMWGLNHALTQTSKRMQRTLGVTGPQRLVVRIVGQRPGISAGALARVLHVHPSTLTGVLKRLRARGAIERTSDPRDTRRALFRLSRKGLDLDTVRIGTAEARVRAALASLPEDDVTAAARVLGQLARALSQDPGTFSPQRRRAGRKAR
jgi:MarR family transcriptional regulator, organic hydroperoxide resistance regulator